MTVISRITFFTGAIFALFILLGSVANAQSCSSGGATSCIALNGNFSVYAYGVSGAAMVWFPTWSSVGGQNDIVWYAGTNLGGGTWGLSSNRSSHPGPGGVVTSHVYLDNDANAGNGAGNLCYGADIPICSSWVSTSVNGQNTAVINAGTSWPRLGFSKSNVGSFTQVSTGGGTASPANDWCGASDIMGATNALAVSGYANGTYYPGGVSNSSHVGCDRDWTVYGYNVDGEYVGAGTRVFSVVAPPPPTVDIWTNPTSVARGANNTYGWSSSGATYCRFYINGALAGDTNSSWGFNNGGWADGPHTADKTYRIECRNSAGVWANDTATLDISPLVTVDSVSSGVAGSCGYVSGWTFDPSRSTDSIRAHMYTVIPLQGWDRPTDVNRADINAVYGISGIHGFAYQMPIGTSGNYTSRVYGIGINSAGVQNGINPSIDTAFSCTPTTPASITATCPSPGNVLSISWPAGGSGTDVYALRIDNTGNGGWPVAGDFSSDSVAGTSKNDFVPTPGATYNIWIHSCDTVAGCNWTTNAGTSVTCNNDVTYTFNDNGATTPPNPVSRTQAPGTPLAAPTDPARTGYTFSGWSPLIPATMPGAGGTSVAQWVDTPPTVNSVTINSGNIAPDNSTQYTVTVTSSDTLGAANITTSYALVNYQGGNAGAHRGYLTWGSANNWPGGKDWRACTGGGWAVIQPAYGDTYMRMDSCTTSAVGDTRTTSFVVRFDPSFTAPITGNDLSGHSYDSVGGDSGWTNFDTNFTISSILTAAKNIAPGSTVTSNPAGINCGADCTELYAYNTDVTLTATPAPGYTFIGWVGGGCGGVGTCGVTMTAATTVTANFSINSYNLTVSKDGTGAGTVSSAPAGINCGGDCSEAYTFGQMVTLTATPTGGSTFTGWTGGGCAGVGNCTVTMTSAIGVTATFASLPDLAATNSGPANGTVFSGTGAVSFTGNAVNTSGVGFAEGGWADAIIDWDADGSFTTYNAFGGAQLGAFAASESKALSYVHNNPPLGAHYWRFAVDTTNVLDESNDGWVDGVTNNLSPALLFYVADGTISADPATINYGATTSITWSSNGTAGLTCEVSGTGGPFAGGSGSEIVTLNANSTYTLSCYQGANPPTALAAVSVTVNTTPVLTSPVDRVETGTVVTLSYDTYGQTCTLLPLGEEVTGPGTRDVTVTALTSYGLDCDSDGEPDVVRTIEIIPTIFES